MSSLLDALELAVIPPIDVVAMQQARERHAHLTKPPGSLGRMEDVGCRICGIQGRVPPHMERMRMLVFAADHGITGVEAVSPYPREVTGQMVANFVHGGAAINALCLAAGADLQVFDVGVATSIPVAGPHHGLVRRPVAAGTHAFTERPAMTPETLAAAMRVGVEAVDRAAAEGMDAVGLGDMGIGNTTAASAITAALLDLPAHEVVGPGTGADTAMIDRKAAVVRRALERHGLQGASPLEILQTVGGFEIAALTAAALRGAQRRIIVVCDGFIVTAAIALAIRLRPAVREYVFAAHASAEPAHRRLLESLGLHPLLDLGMRLGEGSGAALALPLLRAAALVLRDMATFSSAAVSDRT